MILNQMWWLNFLMSVNAFWFWLLTHSCGCYTLNGPFQVDRADVYHKMQKMWVETTWFWLGSITNSVLRWLLRINMMTLTTTGLAYIEGIATLEKRKSWLLFVHHSADMWAKAQQFAFQCLSLPININNTIKQHTT